MKIIPLTQGYEALVDDEDFEFLLNLCSWQAHPKGNTVYAQSKINGKHIKMHRVIMEKYNPGFKGQIDHIDGNGHNNQHSNIRIATNSQNQANRGPNSNNISGYKGVSWEQKNQKWRAQICYQGTKSHLGLYNTAKEAALVYDAAAWSLWKDYSRLNFPEELGK